MTKGLNLSAVAAGLQGRQGIDPKLYGIISMIVEQIETLKNPIPVPSTLELSSLGKPSAPTNFEVEFTESHVLINWEILSSNEITFFDVREGDDWDSAERVALVPTSFLSLNPTNVGTHVYLIGSVGPGGESVGQLEVTFTIPPLGYLSITCDVLDNFVRFSWTIPESTFAIDYYLVEREGISIGRVPGTIFTHFESIAGTIAYSISPVDIAGNIGPKITENCTVRSPIDYELQETRNLSNITSKALTNVHEEEDNSFLAPVDAVETWNEHFVDNSVTTIQGLIGAGYNIWAQPNKSPGTAVFNFTTTQQLNDVIVEINWVLREIIPSVAISASITASGVTHSGTSVFLNTLPTSFSITLTFTAAAQGIVQLLDFNVSVIIKKAQDSGSLSVLSSHTNGTLATFSRDYLDAPDVAAVVRDTGSFYATVSDITADNFRVRVFDHNGNRASKDVEWLARGII